MPPTQDPQTTFKPNLTCILLSARTRYIISIPNGGPCSLNGILNHECEPNAVPIAYFMNPKRTLPPMTNSPVSPFVTI